MAHDDRNDGRMRLLSLEELAETKGIREANCTLLRWERAGRFPRRVHIGKRAYYVEQEIDAHIAELVERRGAA